jgi:DNA-binding protein H-NS
VSAYEDALHEYKKAEEARDIALKKLEKIKEEQKTNAISNILNIMSEFSVSLQDIEKSKNKNEMNKNRKMRFDKGRKLPVKFRDPATGKTWSGRGVPPTWVKLAQAEGRIDTFVVTQEQLL